MFASIHLSSHSHSDLQDATHQSGAGSYVTWQPLRSAHQSCYCKSTLQSHYYPKLVTWKTLSLVDTGRLAGASQSGHCIHVTWRVVWLAQSSYYCKWTTRGVYRLNHVYVAWITFLFNQNLKLQFLGVSSLVLSSNVSRQLCPSCLLMNS